MRITAVRERAVPISRYADAAIPGGGLTTSIVAVTTDVVRDGAPVTGYGFTSIGRFAQSGLIRERFAPRLLAAQQLSNAAGSNLDPFLAWAAMMHGEKPGGHGERCVAVGALDMAVWDAVAKIDGVPLADALARSAGRTLSRAPIPVYAGGGYVYPRDDRARLRDELERARAAGYTRAKIKFGTLPLADDIARLELAQSVLGARDAVAVDAMNAYAPGRALAAAAALDPLDAWWFEDICDPLDFATHARVAERYRGRIAAGEALFSAAEAALLANYGGLRPERDILLFDPAHTYGVTGFLDVVAVFEQHGWPRSAFWPHGGHLFTLHVVAALGLGGAEVNPFAFAPFGGLADGMTVRDGTVTLPSAPGIGFEAKADLAALFATLDAEAR